MFKPSKKKYSERIGLETLLVNGVKYRLFTYLESRNNCRVSIGARGINIRLAVWLSKKEQKQQYLQLKAWAIEHISKQGASSENFANRYSDGGEFEIGGQKFAIKKQYHEREKSTGKLTGHNITLNLSSGMHPVDEERHCSYLVSKLMGSYFLPEIRQRLESLNLKHFRKPIGKVTLRNNTSNWGSCSYNGNISISSRLLFAPEKCVDYVLIHELAHLVEHNHSHRFWKLVEDAMPDYKDCEDWLNKNHQLCQF